VRVVIAGGGLAGLTAARRLAEQGHEVVLCEAQDTLGGRVRSRTVDGFTLDRGFQVCFTAYPAVRSELDLDALDLRQFTPGATLARPGHRSVLADPLRAPRSLPGTLRNRDVTTADKLRLLRLRWRLTRRFPDGFFPGPDLTIREYLEREGFSERFVERFAVPFYGGITLDRSLSSAAAIFEYTFTMLNAGGIAVPADGMGAIPRQLAARARVAGADLRTGTPVEGLTLRGTDGADGVSVTTTASGTVDGDAAIVATDPGSAASLVDVEGMPTEGRGCVTQYFGLPTGSRLAGSPRLVLNTDGTTPNTVAPLSAVAPDYAPRDRALLSATVSGTVDRGDEALADEIRATMCSWESDLDPGDLELIATDRIPFAQVAQPPGCHGALPTVDAPAGPVFLAGDYTRWSSIQGALASGREAAAAVDRTAGSSRRNR
jgi:phytoene dehydrogenase-like protein